MPSTNTHHITQSEALGIDFMTLFEFFRYGTHVQEGYLVNLGVSSSVNDLVNLGWVRRVKGSGRYDTDWLVPSGQLAHRLAEALGSVVLATWANYQERRAL